MKRNNKKALETVIAGERDSLYRLACYRTGNADDANDIVQDVLMKMWTRSKMVSIADVRSYLYRSLLNACFTYRQRHVEPAFVQITADVPDDEQTDDDFTVEYHRITRLMDVIPSEQAEVISLRTIGGKSFGEIAGILNIPESSVKSRFRYGIEKIRKMIYDSPQKTKRL
ncbi:RNA polymerase sigma factor [Xylanibacter muris]|uniref:RNA polymerase sigma factor n=1 Tax=Xylanibacter muris TaxID=2736290 RepID=A0ABX2AKV8_9BACT|nr:RNA polymerase sigma factor [Xylanibacter muris]NPD91745.1 RNA polymerase sigma factor [Xylanibacter muris]